MLTQKNVWRVMALLAAAVLIQASTGVTLVQADRDSAACVQACSALKVLCRNACVEDCQALFGNDTPESNACISACQEECSADQFECKAKCNANRVPPHNAEP